MDDVMDGLGGMHTAASCVDTLKRIFPSWYAESNAMARIAGMR